MKKIFYILSVAALALLASCAKTPIGGTATQKLAGQWYIQVDIVDEKGEVVEDGEDFNGGRSVLLTYNTAENKDNVLYVDDLEHFWAFKVQVPCNLETGTFGAADDKKTFENEAYDCGVTLWGGKIVPGGATTPSGAKADYIEFFVNFDDDDLKAYGFPGVSYPEFYGGYSYKVSGWRYTGLANDD